MKNGLFLLATVTFSSALYAQQPFSRQETEDLFLKYNPQLIARAAQDNQLQAVVEQVISTYTKQALPDTLENQYTIISLARNFENSLNLQQITEQYQRAVLYAQMGNPGVLAPARERARKDLLENYARVWAVSVQVKNELLSQYKQECREVMRDASLTEAEQKARQFRLDNTIRALRADIRQLRTEPEQQLLTLTEQTLTDAEKKVQGLLSSLEADSATNLQIKTKHKKPVAE